MTETRVRADHPCAYCGVPVYGTIERVMQGAAYRERYRVCEVATGQHHECQQQVPRKPLPEPTRCPACKLSVFTLEGRLTDDDAGLTTHACLTHETPERSTWQPPARQPLASPATRQQIIALRAQRGITDTTDLPEHMTTQEANEWLRSLKQPPTSGAN